MRKLLFILLLCLITASAFGQFQQKPMLGLQINWAQSISKGLVGYWLMNEGSGNKVFDLSGNNETGTIDATGLWVPGKFGSCVKFDGADTRIALGTGISGIIAVPGADFTLSAWVNVSGFPENNSGNIFCVHTQAPLVLMWRRDGSGEHFDCHVDYVTSDALTEGSDIGDAAVTGVWTHVVAVHHSATKVSDIYVNGIEESYLSQTAGVGARADRSGEDITIGNDNTTVATFNGLIDLPMIWNRALTASEIALLHREPFCMFKPSWNWMLYGAIGIPTAGGQIIMIQMN